MTDPVRVLAVDDSLTIRKALELILIHPEGRAARPGDSAIALAIAALAALPDAAAH